MPGNGNGEQPQVQPINRRQETDAKAATVIEIVKLILTLGGVICIKGKGTSHEATYQAAPKFFAAYGIGVRETGSSAGSFKTNPYDVDAIFDNVSGFVYTQAELERILPKSKRKEMEKKLRGKCETTTGSFAYYIEVRDPSIYRGYVKLKGGGIYDAATYGLTGGTLSLPTPFNAIEPLRYATTPVITTDEEKSPLERFWDFLTGGDTGTIPTSPTDDTQRNGGENGKGVFAGLSGMGGLLIIGSVLAISLALATRGK